MITRYDDPYQVWVVDDFLGQDRYWRLAKSFPDKHFADMPVGNKQSLGDKTNVNGFKTFMAKSKDWSGFYDFCHRDLPVGIREITKCDPPAVVRFEFSRLPADGGFIRPHPDIAKKVITAVFHFPTEWNESWGGGFEMQRYLKEITKDVSNTRHPWEAVEPVRTIAFKPNRLVIMRRQIDSFHGVRPLTGPAGEFRKSVTVNFMGSGGKRYKPRQIKL